MPKLANVNFKLISELCAHEKSAVMSHLPPEHVHHFSDSAGFDLQGANMAARKANGDHCGVRINGFDDVPRPFLIGVGGGTASGKVGHFY